MNETLFHILRVKHIKTNIGPFNGIEKIESWTTKENFFEENENRKHPFDEFDDGLLKYVGLIYDTPFKRTAYKFGCKTIDQLLNWFSWKELEKLYSLDYKIHIYQSNEVYFGETQVIFFPLKLKEIIEL